MEKALWEHHTLTEEALEVRRSLESVHNPTCVIYQFFFTHYAQ